MNDFLNKVSSYNLFNNLLPGVLFVILTNHFTEYTISENKLLLKLFLFYFIGLTISRLSSITVEPILEGLKFITFKNYRDFVSVDKKDKKLDILVETNNMIRVLFTTILIVIISKVYYTINQNILMFSYNTQKYILLVFFALIYLFAYRKQTNYITKRVETNN